MSRDRVDVPRADILVVDDTRANLRLLSKMLIELHGGTIGLCSVYGHGSAFYFDIPVKPIQQGR